MGNILFLLIVVIASLMPARTRSEGKIPFFKLPSFVFVMLNLCCFHVILFYKSDTGNYFLR